MRAHSLGSAPGVHIQLTDRPVVWLVGLSGSVTDQPLIV